MARNRTGPRAGTTLRWVLVALAFFGAGSQALAQAGNATYPARPIRMVVPFAPGGITDAAARVIAEQLARRFGQQVLVDNRAGASGNIGTQHVATAAADGYTILLVADGNMLISPHVYKNLPYDPLKDFAAVGKLGDTALVLVASPNGSVKSVADAVALAKSSAAGATYGTAGIGSNSHIVGELLKQRTGANLVHVPYKGGGPAMADLMGGQIPLVVTAVAGAISHIKGGKIVALAIPTRQRSPALPEVPTFIEAGFADLVYNSWLGMFAPASTPRAIVERLNAEMNAVTAIPEVRDRLGGMGIVATATRPEAFMDEIRRDLERFGPLIRNGNITAD